VEKSGRLRQELGGEGLTVLREEMVDYIKHAPDIWDVLIIGGGATGLGTAVDSAARGYKTLLLEQDDFAKATSSRSTKLIHGGLRYLKQGNVSLVAEALKERGLLFRNAPHLVSHLAFLIPNYRWWEGAFYGIGLKIYDMLAGKLGIEKSRMLSREETLARIPNLEGEGLKGGTIYYDGQFDDARLAITLAQTAVDLGAVVINYMKVEKLLKKNGLICGVEAVDQESGEHHQLYAKAVINATGIFSDSIRKMDEKKAEPILEPSQGIHLVFPKSFLGNETAILVPQTDDGRVLFMIPWHNHVLIGTTDTGGQKPQMEPKAYPEEIEFLLQHTAKYLHQAPKKKDILSVFAGLRPLVKKGKKSSSALSREHAILISESGLLTICGGKWTTYRKMAQDVVDKACLVGRLKEVASPTETLRLHGYVEEVVHADCWSLYGRDAKQLYDLTIHNPDWGYPLHPDLPYLPVEMVWAARFEMARNLEDLLARRTRALFLNARASIQIAPRAARLLAHELGRDASWEKKQVEEFTKLAGHYTV